MSRFPSLPFFPRRLFDYNQTRVVILVFSAPRQWYCWLITYMTCFTKTFRALFTFQTLRTFQQQFIDVGQISLLFIVNMRVIYIAFNFSSQNWHGYWKSIWQIYPRYGWRKKMERGRWKLSLNVLYREKHGFEI